jgi:hypothetical protein
MSFNLNPQGINGPGWSGNAQQSDYRVPTVNANVASYPVATNMLSVAYPIAAYTQPNQATNVTRAQLSGGPMGVSQNNTGPFG